MQIYSFKNAPGNESLEKFKGIQIWLQASFNEHTKPKKTPTSRKPRDGMFCHELWKKRQEIEYAIEENSQTYKNLCAEFALPREELMLAVLSEKDAWLLVDYVSDPNKERSIEHLHNLCLLLETLDLPRKKTEQTPVLEQTVDLGKCQNDILEKLTKKIFEIVMSTEKKLDDLYYVNPNVQEAVIAMVIEKNVGTVKIPIVESFYAPIAQCFSDHIIDQKGEMIATITTDINTQASEDTSKSCLSVYTLPHFTKKTCLENYSEKKIIWLLRNGNVLQRKKNSYEEINPNDGEQVANYETKLKFLYERADGTKIFYHDGARSNNETIPFYEFSPGKTMIGDAAKKETNLKSSSKLKLHNGNLYAYDKGESIITRINLNDDNYTQFTYRCPILAQDCNKTIFTPLPDKSIFFWNPCYNYSHAYVENNKKHFTYSNQTSLLQFDKEPIILESLRFENVEEVIEPTDTIAIDTAVLYCMKDRGLFLKIALPDKKKRSFYTSLTLKTDLSNGINYFFLQDNNPSQEYIVVKNEDEATLQTLSIKNILNICSLTKTNIPFVQRLYKARGLYSKHPSLEKRLRFVKNRLGLASYFAYKFNVLGGTWLSIASANKEHRYLLDEKLKSYFQKGTYF